MASSYITLRKLGGLLPRLKPSNIGSRAGYRNPPPRRPHLYYKIPGADREPIN